MIEWFAGLLLRYLRISPVQTQRGLHLAGVILAATVLCVDRNNSGGL